SPSETTSAWISLSISLSAFWSKPFNKSLGSSKISYIFLSSSEPFKLFQPLPVTQFQSHFLLFQQHPTLLYCIIHFHAADKDIPKTGQFTKERSFMDLQFQMAGEASQSQQKARRDKSRLTWMVAGKKRACAGKLPFLKPSDLMRLIHYHENSARKTCRHNSITSHQVPSTTRGNCDSYNSR
uniref:Uncharacterized protein n=1 Tax=Macaca mulatta TaxID=9544 RepID=A0A5F8A763_MACMU